MDARTITSDPECLEALCDTWKLHRREIWITVQTASMLPGIAVGARVRIQCQSEPPALGSVIAYRREGSLIVHRLIDRVTDTQGETVYTVCRGDANPESDPPVAVDRFVGVVTQVRPPKLSWKLTQGARRMWRRCRDLARRVSPV